MSFLWTLESYRTPFLDKLMQLITYFGQEIVIIVVICALYWCADKQFAYVLGFTYFTAGLFVQSLKITFRIPRPWLLDPSFHAVESAVSGATGYSFPSGHTQGAVCLFFPTALRTRKIIVKILCASAFLLIGFSRMYLGCHTPKDVVVSALVSILVSLFVWRIRNFLTVQKQHTAFIAVVLATVSLAVCLYAWILYNQELIAAKYAADCFKASGAGLAFSLGWYVERTYLSFDPHSSHLWKQIVKLFLGLSIALLIKEGFPLLFGTSLLAKMAKYFILVLWVLIIYPFLFNYRKRREI